MSEMALHGDTRPADFKLSIDTIQIQDWGVIDKANRQCCTKTIHQYESIKQQVEKKYCHTIMGKFYEIESNVLVGVI